MPSEHRKIFLYEGIPGVKPWYLVYVASSIVNLYQVDSNYSSGAKNWPAPGSHVLNRLMENLKKLNIFLSETTLIFCMQLLYIK